MALFRRNNDVIIALCVRWDRTTLPLRPRLHYIKHTVHWLYCSGCWFHLGSAYLHIKTWYGFSYLFPNFNGCTLKFGNGKVISCHILMGMWLVIHAGITIQTPLLTAMFAVMKSNCGHFGITVQWIRCLDGFSGRRVRQCCIWHNNGLFARWIY